MYIYLRPKLLFMYPDNPEHRTNNMNQNHGRIALYTFFFHRKLFYIILFVIYSNNIFCAGVELKYIYIGSDGCEHQTTNQSIFVFFFAPNMNTSEYM